MHYCVFILFCLFNLNSPKTRFSLYFLLYLKWRTEPLLKIVNLYQIILVGYLPNTKVYVIEKGQFFLSEQQYAFGIARATPS